MACFKSRSCHLSGHKSDCVVGVTSDVNAGYPRSPEQTAGKRYVMQSGMSEAPTVISMWAAYLASPGVLTPVYPNCTM